MAKNYFPKEFCCGAPQILLWSLFGGRKDRIMRSKRVFPFLLAFLLTTSQIFTAKEATACGHDGFYIGLGYEQLFMYSNEDRLTTSAGDLGRISFGPGFGANALIGYDFCGSRWGVQMPFEFARFKLNRSEYINQFGSSLEGVLHLAEWDNGLDVHLVGGFGWSYVTEGKIKDRSADAGITASVGPGLSYYFSRTEKLSAAVALEAPFRMIYYFGSHLSANGTTVLAFPIRLSMQLGF